MSDTGNISGSTNIGRVNVALEVTGVKEANATLDAFAAKAKSIGAAGGSSFAGGSSISGFTTSGHAPSVAGFSMGAVNSPMAAMAAQAPQAAAAVTAVGNAAASAAVKTTVLGSSFVALAGRLVGAGAAVAALIKLYESIKQYLNSATLLNRELAAIGDEQKINISEGLTQQQQEIENANKIYKAAKDKLAVEIENRTIAEDIAAVFNGDAVERVKALQIDTARESALAQIEAHEKNIADLRKKHNLDTYFKEWKSLTKERVAAERAAELDQLEGVAKIAAEQKHANEDLDQRRRDAIDDTQRAELDAIKKSVNEGFEYKKKKATEDANKAQAEKDKRDQEDLDREREKAEQFAQLYTTAANQSRAAIMSAFGNGTSGLLSEMLAKLNVIATGIGRIQGL